MLVGGLGYEVIYRLATVRRTFVARSATPFSKPVAEKTLLHAHVRPVFPLVYGKVFLGGSYGLLCVLTRTECGPREEIPEVFGE
jgi:hypothetical protein